MIKSILKKSFLSKSSKFFFVLFVLIITTAITIANSPRGDIELKLGIEIGNENRDFEDKDETVEKGRFLEFQIKLNNNSSNSYKRQTLLMDAPDYMKYVPGTTKIKNGDNETSLEDFSGGISQLEVGYDFERIEENSETIFLIQYQVDIDLPADEAYSSSIAKLVGRFSAIPINSNLIKTRIFGEAKSTPNATITSNPPAGDPVDSGFIISYEYVIKNVGGIKAENVQITINPPANTTCKNDTCGIIDIGSLEPNQEYTHIMQVEVNAGLDGVTKIVNTGYELYLNNQPGVTVQSEVTHPVDPNATSSDGDFSVIITQEPNIILNSSNGNPRADGADLTESKYILSYKGAGDSPVYPQLAGNDNSHETSCTCTTRTHPNAPNAYFYAYNSSGGEYSRDFNGIGLIAAPINFNVITTLPEHAPKLEFIINTPLYSYGSTTEVNNYMKGQTQSIEIPDDPKFTQSRAVENGINGIIKTNIEASVSRDKWVYSYLAKEKDGTCSCSGEDCTPPPNWCHIYTWQKVSSTDITLSATDETTIDVYGSTAWLKTEKGHIGTNHRMTNKDVDEMEANLVIIPGHEKRHLTPSANYTPIVGDDLNEIQPNAEYMIFAKNGAGDMKTSCGKDGLAENCNDWKITGFDEFIYSEDGPDHGDVYNREINPRSYKEDLLEKEIYGEVKKDVLQSTLTGNVFLEDDIIYYNKGDITIGSLMSNEAVTFNGGQARIYTDGDVYIKSDIKYGTSNSSNYNQITSLRIDARNIYIDGGVEDIEAMLQARNEFHSGISKNQLRILGDVIAKNTFWERQPVLETEEFGLSEDYEINRPSEHIIEDMRKYVIPVPGDTQIKDDYNVWKQVNPSTGETIDGF